MPVRPAPDAGDRPIDETGGSSRDRRQVVRSGATLAALASASVRGLDPVAYRVHEMTGADIDVAEVHDDLHRRWLVRAPRSASAGARLEAEARLLAVLGGRLPFAVPVSAGSAALPGGGRCQVCAHVPGRPLHPGQLQPGPGLSAALGRALAALHDVPPAVVEEAGLPVYEAEEYRQRRLSDLDRAAGTGKVPAPLLDRWEAALEDVGRWRFAPCVVHGDLVAEHVLTDRDAAGGPRVSGILGWGEAKVADPADDLAWVAVGADQDALESVLEAYAHARSEPPDADLRMRARLAGELALARWLLYGVRLGDQQIVDDATGMLDDLAAHADATVL